KTTGGGGPASSGRDRVRTARRRRPTRRRPGGFRSERPAERVSIGSRMPTDDLAPVFRALADPTRRAILQLLRRAPRTTGQLSAPFPRLSRFAVVKHLGVLKAAGLVLVRAEGRSRWNRLNAAPLRALFERWLRPFEAAAGSRPSSPDSDASASSSAAQSAP